jgi:CRP-like cAMP-binding protein
VQVERAHVNHVERVLALRTFQAFHDLSPEALAVIAEHARPRRFPAGALVLRPDRPVRALHFIVSGTVDFERVETGAHKLLRARETIGELAALSDNPRGERAIALEDTVTLELDREDMEDVFEDNFPIFLAVLRTLAQSHIRVRQMLGPTAGFRLVEPTPSETWTRPLGLVQRIMLLRSTMNFARARIAALADVAQECQEVEFAQGESLWRAGDESTYALVIASGLVECVAQGGTQHFELGPASVVGGVDSIAGEPRWYDAATASPVLALRLDLQSMLDVVEDNMDMAVDMLRGFAQVILDLQDQTVPEAATSTTL